MRHAIRLISLLAALALVPGLAAAAGEQSSKKQSDKDAVNQGVHHDACFGDRYESDADLNEGNRISVDEILALINPPRS